MSTVKGRLVRLLVTCNSSPPITNHQDIRVAKQKWEVDLYDGPDIPTYIAGMWVVVKIMVPFWTPIIIRHLIFRVPQQKGP